MRSSSWLSQPIREGKHIVSVTGVTGDEIPYPIKQESMNDSVASYLNTSYIGGFYKSKKDNSYGEIAGQGRHKNRKRPSTSKSGRPQRRHKRSHSGMPTSTSSTASFTHKRWASMLKEPLSAGLLSIRSFGIPGYKVPHCGLQPRRDKNCKILPTKYENFVSVHAKSKEFVPPPGKYDLNRSLIIKNKKMYFGKGSRITMTEEIMKTGKKNRIGPGMYPIKVSTKVKGACKSTERKSLYFVDEAEYKGKNSTGFYTTNHKLVETRVLAPNFKKQAKERDVKIVKKKTLAPNSYNTQDSFNKTQIIVREWKFLKDQRILDFEKVIKRKAYIPPPGKYDIDNAEKKIYKPFGPPRR